MQTSMNNRHRPVTCVLLAGFACVPPFFWGTGPFLAIGAEPVAKASTERMDEATGKPQTTDAAQGDWRHRNSVVAITQTILAQSPKDPNGLPVSANPGRPFTFEEQAYDKPKREWWWNAGQFAVVIIGGLAITYFTGGVVAPYFGSLIGGMTGLSGAAAVSHGLALLGGGAIAAGGFGVAGGTLVIGVVTDLAISTTLEYSLRTLRATEVLAALDKAIGFVDANHDEPAAWETLRLEAEKAAQDRKQYVVVSHAVASAYLRWAADENIERVLASKAGEESEIVISDRQHVLLTAAIHLLEEARRLEPRSSLIHHAIGNAYWWLSVRGGYEEPSKVTADFSLPSSARLTASGKDEVGCFQAALWHYAEGAACEPRNLNVRISWANSLQADGTLHEAIAVLAAALPHVGDCREEDKARLLRTNSMLQYQAFTRSPAWQRFTSGAPFPALQEAPLLLAAMQGYSKVLESEPGDMGSLASLSQIYREAEPTRLESPPSVLPVREVQFLLIESLLQQERSLAGMKKSDLPASYKPGQLLQQYEDLLAWAFKGVGRKPIAGDDLQRLHAVVDGLLRFSADNGVATRPFDRDLVLRVQRACAEYNQKAWVGDYDLKAVDNELLGKPITVGGEAKR